MVLSQIAEAAPPAATVTLSRSQRENNLIKRTCDGRLLFRWTESLRSFFFPPLSHCVAMLLRLCVGSIDGIYK